MSYMTRMQEKAAALREKGHALIMAVESSCDETAIAIVQDGRKVLASQIASQIAKHAEFGGVVPEIASRMHVEALDLLADAALQEAGLTPDAIDAVAVTCGPGLVGALLTGLSWAKAYAYARDLPLVGVNHIEGHVSANYVAHEELEPPFVCLVASGGHSHISLVRDYGKHETLGRTLDDAAGEAFDKVARVLSLPYPGGPLLDKLAEEGDDSAYTFPKPRLENPLGSRRFWPDSRHRPRLVLSNRKQNSTNLTKPSSDRAKQPQSSRLKLRRSPGYRVSRYPADKR